MKYRPELTQELLKRFVFYDPETGVLKRTHVMDRGHNIVRKEFVPKSVTAQGYLQLGMFKRPYLVHRLAWLYMEGRWPVEVDHINGDRLDNRWCNLREVTPRVNRRNMGVPVNNKSGVRGVYWYPRYQRYEVRIKDDSGNDIYLGRHVDFDEAVRIRKEAEKLLGYHENHGGRDSWRK